MLNKHPVVIAIDGTSASGKSTNAKLVAKALGYVYVDTGAMYRTLAWYCLQKRVDMHDEKAVAALCRKWNTSLECVDNQVHLLVDGKYPAKEIRSAETSGAVSHVAAIPKVREWMKKTQRECIRFGNLVMEGRDIGTNVFSRDGLQVLSGCLALDELFQTPRGGGRARKSGGARPARQPAGSGAVDGGATGAKTINTSDMTTAQTSGMIIDEVRKRPAARK